MQLNCSVDRIFAKHPNDIQPRTYKLKFVDSLANSQSDTKKRLDQSKLFWSAAVGLSPPEGNSWLLKPN